MEEELSDDEDFTSLVNPLDNAQASLDLIDGNTYASPDNLNSPCVLELSPPTSISTLSVPSSSIEAISAVSNAIAFDPSPFIAQTGPSIILQSSATPLDFFLLQFDDHQVFQLIVDETNCYATQNPLSNWYPWVDTCVSEVKLFLGMIITMVIHQLPQMKECWHLIILWEYLGLWIECQ